VNVDDALDVIEYGIYEDRVEAAKVLRTAVERVRELHTKDPDGDYCSTCGPAYHTICCGDPAWPCPTIQALDGPS
jgi:hypothetical protein